MKMLIAEDDIVYRRLLQATLTEWGYTVIVTCDGAEARQVLSADDAPRLAILDWMMPGVDGIEVCRELRMESERPYIYVLLLTAKDGKKDVIEGLEAGADDYLIKPFDAHELRARLSAGRRILELQDQLIAAREALRVQATHDPLTGLWNRAAILDILARELARAQREATAVGAIMADLDHFKPINDTYGHLAGDGVLREVAHRMVSTLRPYDTIGRYGGEEFLVVLPGCDLPRTVSLAERLRESISGRGWGCPRACSPSLSAWAPRRPATANPQTRPPCSVPPTPPCTLPRTVAATASSRPLSPRRWLKTVKIAGLHKPEARGQEDPG